jgi:MHS family proline/betaine transporter-like MFS transporter
MNKKMVIAVAIFGSFIEWYDFALIGALSTYINKNFFDIRDPMNSLINVFLIFAVGYFSRPLGAVFFGYYGDQFGRKTALRLSLFLVSLATLLIGCLPTLDQVGVLVASVSLVVLRFVQGFGSGGEHAGGILLLYEDEKENKFKRTNYINLSIMVGLFFGFVSAYILRLFFTEDAISEWAWRIPFIVGGVLGLVCMAIRMLIIPKKSMDKISTGLMHYKLFFNECKKQIFVAFGIYIHSVAIFYINYFFYPEYAVKQGLVTLKMANEARVFMAVVFIFLFIILNKYINGRNARTWLKISSINTVFLIFPLNYGMVNFGQYGYFLAIGVLTVLNVIYLLPIAGMLPGLFPEKYRYTGLSLSINIISSLFGGVAPLFIALLVSRSGSFVASGVYLFFTAIISYLTIFWGRLNIIKYANQ